MDQKAYLAIAAMLNAFPQGNNNPDVTMKTFEAVLRDVSSKAVIDAAQRFTSGLVEGQSVTFAPSVAEFAIEARKHQRAIEIEARPRLPGPVYVPTGEAPFERKIEKLKQANAHLPVLFEDVSHDRFLSLSKQKAIPVGAKWVAGLGIIYGPAPAAKSEAA